MRGRVVAAAMLGAVLLSACQAPAPDSRSTEGVEAMMVASACVRGQVELEGRCLNAEVAYVAPGGRTRWVHGADPDASDAGPGTAERPWRTISRAARRGALRPGDAVLIRAGVYRESVRPASGGTPDARVTYAAYPGETVVISGADPADEGWTREPDGAWRRPWTAGPMPTYSDDSVFRREMVVAAGHVLQPVARREDLVLGTSWTEGPGTAPTALVVRFVGDVAPEAAGGIEVATRRRLFDPVGDDVHAACDDATAPGWLRVVGLTLRHAANRAQWGALCAGSEGALVEDVRVEWTIGLGVDGSGRDHVFRRVQADYNGQAGWGASCTRCVVEDGTAIGNNWRGHDLFWEAGGGKWNATTETVIRRMVVRDNDGPGIWLDGQNARNTIEANKVVGNAGAGILLELETTATLVQHNLVAETRWRDWTGAGVLSQAASENVIRHNTIVDNEGTGVWIRLDPLRRAPDGGNAVVHNWIVGNAARASVEAREIAIEGASEASMRSTRWGGNAYGRVLGDAVLRSTFFAMPTASGDHRGSDLEAWRKAVGGDPGSVMIRSSLEGPEAYPAPPMPARQPAGAQASGRIRSPHVGANREALPRSETDAPRRGERRQNGNP